MQRFLLILVGLAAGCSLIVGNKLDEKSSDGGKRPLERLRGEHGGEAGPFTIGEQIEIPLAGLSAKVGVVTIVDDMGEIPCVGSTREDRYTCTIAPLSPDGAVTLRIKDEAFATLKEEKISVRRLVAGGKLGEAMLKLLDQGTLVSVGEVSLPGRLTEQLKPSHSGRYLIAGTDKGTALVDLVNQRVAPLPCKNARASAFEPEFGNLKYDPKVGAFIYFSPERALRCAAAAGLVRVELPEPPGAIDASGALKAGEPAGIGGVLELASMVDLSAQRWVVGIGTAPNRVFVLQGGETLAVPIEAAEGTPEQVSLAVVEEVAGTLTKAPVYGTDLVPVVRTSSHLLLFRLEGGKLVQKSALAAAAMQLRNMSWAPYTNLLFFDRTTNPGQEELLYVSVAGKPPTLVPTPAGSASKPVMAPGEQQAFALSPLDQLFSLQTYSRRFGVQVGDRVILAQDYPIKTLLYDKVIKGARRVLGHPRRERLLVQVNLQLVPHGFNLSPITTETPVAFEFDAPLIQP